MVALANFVAVEVNDADVVEQQITPTKTTMERNAMMMIRGSGCGMNRPKMVFYFCFSNISIQ